MKKEKIKNLIKESRNEVNRYKKTKNLIYLMQASEKVWVAFSLLLERLSGKEIYNYPQLKKIKNQLVEKTKISELLYERAYFLHIYHYEGWADPEEVIRFINFCSKEILKLNR